MSAAVAGSKSKRQVSNKLDSNQTEERQGAYRRATGDLPEAKQKNVAETVPKHAALALATVKQQLLKRRYSNPTPTVVDSKQIASAQPVSSQRDTLPATPAAQIDTHGGDPNFMTSLARGLAVIQAFTQRQRELTVSQISVRTGFSRAAVRRCLYTLAKLGFAATDDSRHFHLRPRVLALGHSYISSMPLAAMAQPILENVSQSLHESCSIAALDKTEIIYIARANVTRIMSIDLGIGSKLPAFCTSMGRVLIAGLPADHLNELLGRVEFKRYTERTVGTSDKLRQILRLVQRNGYCIVDQELESGLRSLAVPIRDFAGRVVAALNVGTHAQRVSIQDLQNRFLPQLRAAAQELSLIMN